MEQQIQQLYGGVMKYEEPEVTIEMKQQLLTWFKSIANPQFSLVDGLIQMFIDKQESKELQTKILKVLKKLNEYIPELVGPQFFQNAAFPEALVNYMTTTEMHELAGDSFILLINIFNDKVKPEIYTKEFASKLQASLEFIEEENIKHSLASILVCLCPLFEARSENKDDISNNIVLSDMLSQEKDSYWREELIHLANRGAHYRLDKCCEVINIIFDKVDYKNYYFNKNDINLIMDILLREVLTNTFSETRVQIYKLMTTLLSNDTYKEDNYKIDEVKEMIFEQIRYEEDEIAEKQYSENELACIADLDKFFKENK